MEVECHRVVGVDTEFILSRMYEAEQACCVSQNVGNFKQLIPLMLVLFPHSFRKYQPQNSS